MIQFVSFRWLLEDLKIEIACFLDFLNANIDSVNVITDVRSNTNFI